MQTQLTLASSTAARTLWARVTSGIFGRGALAFLVASAFLNVFNFLFHVVVSRLVGPVAYGGLGAVLGFIAVLTVPIGAVQLAVTRAVGLRDKGATHTLRPLLRRASLGGIGGMVLTLAATPYLDGYLHFTSPLPVVLTALWIPVAVATAILQGSLIGEYRFMPVAIATFVGGGLVRLAVGVSLAVAGYGTTGAMVATLASQIVVALMLVPATRHQIRSTVATHVLSTGGSDVALSLLALAGLSALTGVDTVLARHYFTASLAGQYAAGAIAAHIALYIPGALVAVTFPHLADGGISDASRKAFIQGLKYTALLGALAAAVMVAFPHLLTTVLFGSRYPQADVVVRPLGIASALLGVLSLLTYLHIARRRVAALVSWLGVAGAIGVIALLHASPRNVALTMLTVIAATTALAAVPSWIALTTAAVRPDPDPLEGVVLPPSTIDITLVIPFYKPGPALVPHVWACSDVLAELDVSYEILGVSDGSPDDSADVLENAGIPSVRVIRLPENEGKGSALRTGLIEGRGRYLGFIDADGDLDATLLRSFVAAIQSGEPDIVYGSKVHRDSRVVYPPLRRVYSLGYRALTRLLFATNVRDTQTGVKLVKREVVADVLPRMVEKRFAFDLELFVVARKRGHTSFVDVPVAIRERFSSTVSWRTVRDTLLDTLAIFYRLRILRYYDRSVAAPSIQSTELDGSHPGMSERDERGLSAGDDSTSHPARLRILVLNWRDITHPNAGGAEVYTHHVIDQWMKMGHQVTLFCAAIHGRPSHEVTRDGLTIIRRGSKYGVYRAARRYYLNEARGSYDLVIDEVNTRPFMTPAWATDVPTITLIHQVCRELWSSQYPQPLASLGRYVLEPMWLRRYRDAPVVTVSNSSRDSLQLYGLRNISVIPEGFEQYEISPGVPKEIVPTVIFVGRLEAHKRPDHAITAFTLLKEELPNAQMWVVGSGPLLEKLRRRSPSGVTFFGNVSESEKFSLLARAHVLVATSVREGWGLIVTEAALAGTPSIGYAVPGLIDSVTAANGILTSPHPREMSRALYEYFTNTALSSSASLSGVTTWSSVACRILALHAQVENALP